ADNLEAHLADWWTIGVGKTSPSPATSASSGTHDQNWYITAHGVTTAFDGPVVPDVNMSEWMSRYSGPGHAGASVTSRVAARNSSVSTATTRSSFGTSAFTSATRSAYCVVVTNVVASEWSMVYASMRPMYAVLSGTSTTRRQPSPSNARCESNVFGSNVAM